jgi:GNAT superfamily N-acetyltransferase
MQIEVSEERSSNLEDYARIRMSFDVQDVLDVTPVDDGFGGFRLSERKLETPYLKDYDAIENPLQWPRSFDISNWGFFAARSGGWRVGGAAVAFNTSGLTMLEDRRDIAILWDIRVAAETRGQGVGAALFRAVEEWAVARGCRWLKVETQNINVPGCRFYAKQGCALGAIDRFAYPEFPNEVQLLWYKDLTVQTGEPGPANK